MVSSPRIIATALKGDDVRLLTHREIEIEDPASIARALDGLHGVVINTAAYNLVDKAESEPERAFAVNELGVRNLASTAQATTSSWSISAPTTSSVEIPLVRRRSSETAQPRPVSVYAESKLAGENSVRDACRNHLIIRTCGLYGLAATKAKGNFIETMLRLGRTRPELSVVDDQHCTPSYTVDVAQATVDLINAGATGPFHVTNSGGDDVVPTGRGSVPRGEASTSRVEADHDGRVWSESTAAGVQRAGLREAGALLGRPMPDWQECRRAIPGESFAAASQPQ